MPLYLVHDISTVIGSTTNQGNQSLTSTPSVDNRSPKQPAPTQGYTLVVPRHLESLKTKDSAGLLAWLQGERLAYQCPKCSTKGKVVWVHVQLRTIHYESRHRQLEIWKAQREATKAARAAWKAKKDKSAAARARKAAAIKTPVPAAPVVVVDPSTMPTPVVPPKVPTWVVKSTPEEPIEAAEPVEVAVTMTAEPVEVAVTMTPTITSRRASSLDVIVDGGAPLDVSVVKRSLFQLPTWLRTQVKILQRPSSRPLPAWAQHRPRFLAEDDEPLLASEESELSFVPCPPVDPRVVVAEAMELVQPVHCDVDLDSIDLRPYRTPTAPPAVTAALAVVATPVVHHRKTRRGTRAGKAKNPRLAQPASNGVVTFEHGTILLTCDDSHGAPSRA